MRTAFVAVAFFIAMCIACTFAAELVRIETIPTETEAQTLFQKFKADYEVTYKSSEEEAVKFAVFQENLKEIVRLNKINTKATFVVNQFADWTKEERESLSGTRIPEEVRLAREAASANVTFPDVPMATTIDWRNMGVVTPVKNQKQCGSCWAFSATESIESAYALAGHPLQVLSPQNVLDCSGGGSCSGGYPETAIDYGRQGVDLDSSYPYTAVQQRCQHNNQIGGYSTGHLDLAASEDAIFNQIQFGPVGIVIDATNIGFFGAGYMNAANCDHSGLDHAIQAVGVGKASDGTLVWIVRNSWGASWGDKGYFYIAKGQKACLVGSWNYIAKE